MPESKCALIVGASRGLGAAIVEELLERGWRVTGTCRQGKPTQLHTLAGRFPATLEIENVDITREEDISALKSRLTGRNFDLLFVNAGVATARDETVEIGRASCRERV